jgi:hypothetical protein
MQGPSVSGATLSQAAGSDATAASAGMSSKKQCGIQRNLASIVRSSVAYIYDALRAAPLQA